MTKRKRNSQQFKRLRRQAVETDFEGGTLTTDGGLLLLREVDRKLNLIDRIDNAIPDPRDPRYIQHTQSELLAARIFGIAAGYEDGNDHQQLRYDPAFQIAADKSPGSKSSEAPGIDSRLASPSTLSRLENRVDAGTILKLHEILVDTFLDSHDQPPREIILDIDATDDPTHGDQEKKYFNGFYDGYCFLPLYIFCGDQLLVSHLRPSRRGAAHHARPICKLLVESIRARWPDTRIILRGDSGFCTPQLLRWCERAGIGYVLGLQKNPTLLRYLEFDRQQSKDDFDATDEKQRRFTWLHYKAGSWKRKRRVIGKAEHTAKGENPRFVITNLFDDTTPDDVQCSPVINPQEFYDQWYCPRGEMENRIKEQKLFLFADRTSCTDFAANQFRLMLSSFAYVLLDGLRRIGLKDTPQSRWRVDTIRLKLLKIAARVCISVRRVVFHLATGYPYQDLFDEVASRLVLTADTNTG